MIQLQTKDMRIAIQSKGRLKKSSLKYLDSKGFKINAAKKSLMSSCKKYETDIIYLRDDDIPQYVASGIADFGIIGENVYYESPSGAKIIKKLGFGKCSLIIAIPKEARIKNIGELSNKKIATSYPNLLKSYLNKANVKAEIIVVKGSTEIAPSLGLADAICDLVQTGKTLQTNGLKKFVKIMNSEAVLIESPCLKKITCNPLLNENN